MQTFQQQTSAKPDLSEEGPTKGKRYTWNGLYTSYSSCTNQGNIIYVGHKWAWVIHKWLPAWPGPRRPSHGQLCGLGNWPRPEKMHISSSLHITGGCEGGSVKNGGGVNAPRDYYYTQGYHQGTSLCTNQAHRRRCGSLTFKRLVEHWWAQRALPCTQRDHIWSKKHYNADAQGSSWPNDTP